jgi:hypothetical protein
MNRALQRQAPHHRGFAPFGRPRGGSSSMRTAAARSAVRELQAQVASKQRSAVEITREYLQRLRSVEDALGSFITVDDGHALAQARRAGVARGNCGAAGRACLRA